MMNASSDGIVAIQNLLAECQIVRDSLGAINTDLRAKLNAANARASELWNELGIGENAAQTQIGELVRQVAALTAERDEAIEALAILRAERDIAVETIAEAQAVEEAIRHELTALRQIALTDEACDSLAPEVIAIVTHSYALDLASKVSKAIRAARGAKEGG